MVCAQILCSHVLVKLEVYQNLGFDFLSIIQNIKRVKALCCVKIKVKLGCSVV